MHKYVKDAIYIIKSIGLPKAQQNERSALCLLALLNMTPNKSWAEAEDPLMGITPIMNWIHKHYDKKYAPNTRETIRRQTIHQFVDDGIVVCNPDKPDRAVNSPKTVYQIEPTVLQLIKNFDSPQWGEMLRAYLSNKPSLSYKYLQVRKQNRIAVRIANGQEFTISPGDHSLLIKSIIEDFAPRFAPGSLLVYVGDTQDKWKYFKEELLVNLGVEVDFHGKMPDVIFYYKEKNWLLIVEAVTSHGPVNIKRHNELARLFSSAKAGLVFVTAFPDRAVMAKYISEIAWETEVWIAAEPSHLIHFDGERFLGPY